MKKGFTLLELRIVVIVIGILASIAIPQFLNAVEKGRVAKAKNALGLIAHAEKMYRAEIDTYFDVDSDNLNGEDDEVDLGDYIELTSVDEDQDWIYSTDDITAITFTVTATKAQGANSGATITLTQDGVCRGDHPLRGRDCTEPADD